MAKQTINLGTVTNDGTGTTLKTGGEMINDNFDELYAYENNATTSDLSLSTLNSTYPDVRVGFEVFCENITGTKHLYKKSHIGWVKLIIDPVV